MKDFRVWNAVTAAYHILEEAEEVTVTTFRDVMLFLQQAISELEKRGRQV